MQNLLRDHTMKTENVREHTAKCANCFSTHSCFFPDDISAVKLALIQKSKLEITL